MLGSIPSLAFIWGLAAGPQSTDKAQGGTHNDENAKSEAGSEGSSGDGSETVEGIDELPSAMDVLRRAGMVVKEPSKNCSGPQVPSKRLAKELRVR